MGVATKYGATEQKQPLGCTLTNQPNTTPLLPADFNVYLLLQPCMWSRESKVWRLGDSSECSKVVAPQMSVETRTGNNLVILVTF